MNLAHYHKTQSAEAQREAIKEKINALNREMELLETQKSQATFDIAQKLVDAAQLSLLHGISVKEIQKALQSIHGSAVELTNLIPMVNSKEYDDDETTADPTTNVEAPSTKNKEAQFKESWKKAFEIDDAEEVEAVAPSVPSAPAVEAVAPSVPSAPVVEAVAPSAPAEPAVAPSAPSAPAPSAPAVEAVAPSAPSAPSAPAPSAPAVEAVAPSTPAPSAPAVETVAPSAPSTPAPSAPSVQTSSDDELDADYFMKVLKENRN